MRALWISVALGGCAGGEDTGEDSGDGLDTGTDTADTGDTADTADTGDTEDTADTGDTADTADTADVGPADWEVVGVPNFVVDGVSEPNLTVAPDGTPFVAFSDDSQAGKTSVMTFDGAEWVYVGTPGISQYGNNRFPQVVLHEGQPWVTYRQNPGDQVFVQRFDGTSWTQVGPGAVSAGEAAFPSLAFDSAGTPHVAYRDYVNGSKTTVMRFDGAAWVPVGAVGITPGVAWLQRLAFDGDTPYVAYASEGTAPAVQVTVQSFDGTHWSLVGAASISATDVGYLDFTVADGAPYLFYGGKVEADETAVVRFDGTAWTRLGDLGRHALNSRVSLTVADGTPYVAFKDWDNTSFAPSVLAWDGSTWASVGTADTTGQNDDELAVAAGGGRLYLAVRDASASPRSLTVWHIGR